MNEYIVNMGDEREKLLDGFMQAIAAILISRCDHVRANESRV